MSTVLDTQAKVIAVYGGTSWTQITDKFLIGASNTYTVKSTGGEATHTLTINEMPSHNHPVAIGVGYGQGDSSITYKGRCDANCPRYDWAGSSSNVGGGQAHNNIPPYYAVYIWVRTA